jgi:2-oxoisovalerate dehydrogenase E2 component (dihydrolipoyl transacylase)
MIRSLSLRQLNLFTRLAAPFALLRFPLPDLGEKIKEGRVKKLYVKEGDRICEFEKVADVESDKQFTEITSPEEGVIKKLYYREDETCQVGDIFLEMDTVSSAPH